MGNASLGHATAATRVSEPGGDAVLSAPIRLPTVPAERRPTWATLATLTIVTGVAAVALAGWVVVNADIDSDADSVAHAQALDRAAAILAGPGTRRFPLAASAGRLVVVVGEGRDGVLIVRGLGQAAEGRVYQAWVAAPGSAKLRSAGLFDGSEPFVPLAPRLAPGSIVSVTLEEAGGAAAPSRVPRLTTLVG